jgi:hypothetical protein
MSEAVLPRGPFPGDDEQSRLSWARNEALWLWGFWDGNTLVPARESDREMIQLAFENLLKALEE